MTYLIGVISDTHGLLRPKAVLAPAGVDAILHAGDIGKVEILGQLDRIAPVTAVRGNNDKGDWLSSCPILRSSSSVAYRYTFFTASRSSIWCPEPPGSALWSPAILTSP
jgi:putative phosphoesterase